MGSIMDDAQFQIPTHCKAGVVVNEGPNFHVEVQMVPVPEPGPDDILVKLNFTGLCSSDIHMMQGDLGLPPMSTFGVRSPGHEGAGVVVKVGANVKNFKLGDRAGIKPMMDTCGCCALCCDDKETYCKDVIHTGLMTAGEANSYVYPRGLAINSLHSGTYQQYLVSPARYASPIPDGVPDEVAAPIMCSASTIYRSLMESNLRAGAWVVFPGGGGGVGIQGVQLAKAMGLRPIVVDTGDSKRKLALEMGAEAFVDFKEVANSTKAVIGIADGVGVHGVIVTAPAAYKTAVSFIGQRIGAIVMCIGLPAAGSVTLGTDPCEYIFKNLTIKGTLVGSRKDTAMALDFARRGMLRQISEVYPVNRLPEAVEKLRRGEVAGRIVINFNWEE
ncbi:Polyketide synthase enoylreductase [Penicillium paradoxum]|uniref:Polyketide synthase enoylreductase n=1 Tax=Penicillium paradoxum TaxID=176176 RepID=UPI002546D4A9|nr:Polyketide synthase enoylreductase [Penicillium paradoxum]KAJ5773760.1 Polyketide synthase enoylreductase [Penicillium paradoxum]